MVGGQIPSNAHIRITQINGYQYEIILKRRRIKTNDKRHQNDKQIKNNK